MNTVTPSNSKAVDTQGESTAWEKVGAVCGLLWLAFKVCFVFLLVMNLLFSLADKDK